MCMKSTPEGCELRDELIQTKSVVSALDARLTKVERDLGSMRSETQEGIRALTESVANLAHDFGSRMNSMDARLVEEKVKWGDTLRTIAKWIAALLVVGCCTAMGLTAYKTIFAAGG